MRNINGWSRSFSTLAMQVLCDVVLINFSMLAAMYMRFDGAIAPSQLRVYSYLWPVMTLLCLGAFALTRMYRSLWQYAGVEDALSIVLGTAIGMGATLGFGIVTDMLIPRYNYFLIGSKTVYPIAWLMLILLVGAQRFSTRFIRLMGARNRSLKRDACRRVLVVGAGWAGASLIREMNARGFRDGMPVVAVDDDPGKAGTHLGRVKVLPGVGNIPAYVEKYAIDEIIIAIPSATRAQMQHIMSVCSSTDCKLKLVPMLHDVTGGTQRIGEMRDINIADLLCREEVRLDMGAISGYLKGRVVLVTGGGGSIGSELCRQVARFEPGQLVIFDIYENNAYELANELKALYGEALSLQVLIGSVRDVARLEAVFRAVRPDVVFHAAAHKHVPLMEFSPAEAVKNNVFGTLNVARCADRFGVERMVLLSTDKAVNPPNVMGATKRATEMIIQYMARKSKTRFMAVRFGNVLGSNGSVIPLFRQQIARGGPVTVTDPEITRYFMTIPEASQLVLQAGAIGESGNIFVLDMGTPVKIVDLARNLIKLSGFKPDEDIKIEYVGLRPGEKLYEELMMHEEETSLHKTHHEMIFVLSPIQLDVPAFERQLDVLLKTAQEHPENIREELHRLVPTYRLPDAPAADRQAG